MIPIKRSKLLNTHPQWRAHGIATAYSIKGTGLKGNRAIYMIEIVGILHRSGADISYPMDVWTDITTIDGKSYPIIPDGYRPNVTSTSETPLSHATDLTFLYNYNGDLPITDGASNYFRIDSNGLLWYKPLFNGAPGSGGISSGQIIPLKFNYVTDQADTVSL